LNHDRISQLGGTTFPCNTNEWYAEIYSNEFIEFTLISSFSELFSFIVPGIKAVYDKKLMHTQVLELVKLSWEQVLLLDDCQIAELLASPSQPLFVAAEFGIVEFITALIRSYPDLIWKVNEQSRSIFHIAVAHRQEKIFSLINDIGAHKDMITAYKDINNANILHLAGMIAPRDKLNVISGAALQMQRELLWFKVLTEPTTLSYFYFEATGLFISSFGFLCNIFRKLRRMCSLH
jgi:hypothetical protein